VFLLWAFVTVPLALALIWVGLVLVGLVRQTDELDRRLTVVVAAMPGKINRLGLPVGALVPAFKGRTLDGHAWDSSSLADQEHLILFAHPGCAPCEELVPELISAVEAGHLPRTVIVSEGAASEHPEDWREVSDPAGRVTVLLQDGHSVAKRLESFVTPHFFLVGSDHRIVAQAVATTLEEVKVISRRGRSRSLKGLQPASP
jgi:hypothetical protein